MKIGAKSIGLFIMACSLAVLLHPLAIAKNSSKTEQPIQNLDKVVAVVNDDVITERELQKRIGFLKIEASHALMPPENILRNQVLNVMIDQLIALQAATRAGVDVDSEEVNQAIDSLLKRNHLSKTMLEKLLYEQNLNMHDYHAMVRNELVIQQFLQREVGSRITIPKEEVDKYLHSLAYDHNHITEYLLSDILISLPDIPSSDAVQSANEKAQTVLKKLEQGVAFKELAIGYSDAPNALQGGDMGWRHIEEIPSVFGEKIETMRPGEYIGPIKTANGLHILKLEQVKGAKVRHIVTEHKTRHILVKVAMVDDEESIRHKMLDLRKRIAEGERFDQLAKQYSQDPMSAAKGGDLGWVPSGVMVREFEAVMLQQKIGEISLPFRSEFGWHILVVDARRQKDNTSDHYANELRNKIYQRKFSEESQSFLRRLRSVSYIVKWPS